MAIAGPTGTTPDAHGRGVAKGGPMAIAGPTGTTPDSHGRDSLHWLSVKFIVIGNDNAATAVLIAICELLS